MSEQKRQEALSLIDFSKITACGESERISRKILLTSAGFESKTISDTFLNLVGKEPKEIQALFIPTAAIFPAAITVLPKCMEATHRINALAQNGYAYTSTGDGGRREHYFSKRSPAYGD